MSSLNKNPNSGYNPCTNSGVALTVTYQPALGTSGNTSGVKAIHTAGKAADVADDATQQASTASSPVGKGNNGQFDGLVSGIPVVDNYDETPAGPTYPADNFLPCTSQPTDLGDPIANPAQAPSAGKSLSPAHE
jgi:hypothetical protein